MPVALFAYLFLPGGIKRKKVHVSKLGFGVP